MAPGRRLVSCLHRQTAGLSLLVSPVILLIPAAVWGITPLLYKSFLEKTDAATLNLLRTLLASAVLTAPFLLLGFGPGLEYGALSGLLTLAIGDTLYFVSIRLVGASIATPILYSQTVLIQLIAPFIGEPLSSVRLISAALIVIAVYLLSRGDGTRVRVKGIAVGLVAAGVESVGQSSIKLAAAGNSNPFSIAFSRTSVAAAALCEVVLASRARGTRTSRWRPGPRDLGVLAILSVGDIAISASIFIFAVASAGIAVSTVVLGLSPLVTQLGAKVSKRESPSRLDLLGGAIITLAIALTIL